jgi:hypothetical protein
MSVDRSKLNDAVPTLGPYGMLTSRTHADMESICDYYLKRDPKAEKWHVQSFAHGLDNEDISMMGVPMEEEQDWVQAQLEVWEHVLSDHFPKNRFVLEQAPFEELSWYQAWPGAPIEDDPHWYMWDAPAQVYFADLTELEQALDDIDLFCEMRDRVPREKGNLIEVNRAALDRLVGWYDGITPPEVDARCPGIMLATDRQTGKPVRFAGRVIRKVIGPQNSTESNESEFLVAKQLPWMTRLAQRLLGQHR